MANERVQLDDYLWATVSEGWEGVLLDDGQDAINISAEQLEKLAHMLHKHKSDEAIREAALRDVPNNEHIVLGTD
jgi:hypothetical protein